MEFAKLRSRYDGFQVPRFTLVFGNVEIRSTDNIVSTLEVQNRIGSPGQCEFKLVYPYDVSTGRFDGVDYAALAAGERVEAYLGYGSQLKLVFVGLIDEVSTQFPATGVPHIGVTAFDVMHELSKYSGSADESKQSDSEIVEGILQQPQYQFTGVEVEDTGTEVGRETLRQTGTDRDFVLRLAKRNGFEVLVRENVFHFRAPKHADDPQLVLSYGESLVSFVVAQSRSETLKRVTVRHWDPDPEGGEPKAIVGVAESPKDAQGELVFSVPVRSKEEAEARAAAILTSRTAGFIQGTGETIGIPELVVGQPIHVAKVGTFTRNGGEAGSYYVRSVTHRFGTAGYTTNFEVTESAEAGLT